MPRKKVKKDWGHEEYTADEPEYCGKLLVIDPDWQCSLHMHPVKKETFFVLTGMVVLELGSAQVGAIKGDRFTVLPGTKHRFGSIGGATLIETSTHHEDDDVVRFEPSRRISEDR